MAETPGYTKYFPVSWDEIHRNGRALAWRLMEFGPFEGIVAVTRGGLVPAAIVARELNIRHIETVCIAAYRDDKSVGEVNITKALDLPNKGKGWLIVDDLVDSGITAKYVREMIPEAHFATLYAKPKGREQIDSFITEVSQDTWILFPWDQAPSFVEPMVQGK
ncbi:MAG: xanthine phosphoribosyltransferase [Sneathiella sp.]|nr:xanthine phosphoribosyltransferase [Sneathiella sp.]